ncbi:uncharacterized protein [Dermacentor albipictus]|uniref:uncharacterized protein n=1 Tax=Dermacentor albipictus TaxID=60249 RepID=UPI0038FCBC9E
MGAAQSTVGHATASSGSTGLAVPDKGCSSPSFHQQQPRLSVGRRSSSVAPGAVLAMELEISKLKASLERRDREIVRLNREVHKLQSVAPWDIENSQALLNGCGNHYLIDACERKRRLTTSDDWRTRPQLVTASGPHISGTAPRIGNLAAVTVVCARFYKNPLHFLG